MRYIRSEGPKPLPMVVTLLLVLGAKFPTDRGVSALGDLRTSYSCETFDPIM